MKTTEDFIYNFEGSQREIMLYFHKVLTEEFGLRSKLSYKIPFYYNKSWVCYLNPTKNGNIEFAFPRGNELSNSNGILESKGRKQVYSIEIKDLSGINEALIKETIMEAILLDDTTPYQSKR